MQPMAATTVPGVAMADALPRWPVGHERGTCTARMTNAAHKHVFLFAR